MKIEVMTREENETGRFMNSHVLNERDLKQILEDFLQDQDETAKVKVMKFRVTMNPVIFSHEDHDQPTR